MPKLKGISITIEVKTQTGTDPLGAPVFSSRWETVENVLVGQPDPEEVKQALDIQGKKVIYKLAIPKGDEHDWENTRVMLPEPYSFAGTYMTVGFPISGIDELVPLSWNQKVLLERYGH